MISPADQLTPLLAGCAQVLSEKELQAKLALGRPLRVKLGVDPTSPDIHLGHTVGLTKLRQFQELGHEAILIIGDFTAMIGDPSGRTATRPHLSHEQVLEHAKTYQAQAFKILDPEKTTVRFNGQWFKAMSFEDVMRLNSRVTLQQMLQREDFRERIDKGLPVRAHEIQYPIMQGWDSVVIQADVELGGTDQLFNILVGRDLQHEEGQHQQVAMMLPILTGLDGIQKMSKSLGNAVGVSEPPSEMFGKLMSISDEQMAEYYRLLLHEEIPEGMHPMEAKKSLAERLTSRYHTGAEARHAREEFELRFSKKNLESVDLPSYTPASNLTRDIISIGADAFDRVLGIKKSKGDVRRLVEGGSVSWRGEKITDPKATLPAGESGVLKLDRKNAVRIG
ncbi:MAG: tyrosine--tRNA ligase [Verrucomicrobia bacterium]|nr:tyrosine--tRNA ligase [Verrucomicrobiota bacterium]